MDDPWCQSTWFTILLRASFVWVGAFPTKESMASGACYQGPNWLFQTHSVCREPSSPLMHALAPWGKISSPLLTE